jgi:hypothetical protein
MDRAANLEPDHQRHRPPRMIDTDHGCTVAGANLERVAQVQRQRHRRGSRLPGRRDGSSRKPRAGSHDTGRPGPTPSNRITNAIEVDHGCPAAQVDRHGSRVPRWIEPPNLERVAQVDPMPSPSTRITNATGRHRHRHGSPTPSKWITDARPPRSIDTDHGCPVAAVDRAANLERMTTAGASDGKCVGNGARSRHGRQVKNARKDPRSAQPPAAQRHRQRITNARLRWIEVDHRCPAAAMIEPPNLERVAQDDPMPSPSKWITGARLPR